MATQARGDVVQRLILQAQADVSGASGPIDVLVKKVGGLTGALKLSAAGMAALVAGVAVASSAALKQQASFDRLRNSVAASGIEYDKVEKQLRDFMSAQQQLTSFTDEETADIAASLAQLTAPMALTSERLIEMTSLTQDMTAALGIEAPQATRVMAQAMTGNLSALNRVLPGHRDLIKEIQKIPDASERAARATELLSGAFKGAAQEGNNLQLGVDRLRNGIVQVVQNFGDMFVQSGAVGESVNALADAVNAVGDAFSSSSTNGQQFSRLVTAGVADATAFVIGLATEVLSTFQKVRGAAQEVARVLGIGESGDDGVRERNQRRLDRLRQVLERNDDSAEGRAQRLMELVARDGELLRVLEDTGQLSTGSVNRMIRDYQSGGTARERFRQSLDDLLRQTQEAQLRVGMQRGAHHDEWASAEIELNQAQERLREAQMRALEARNRINEPYATRGVGDLGDLGDDDDDVPKGSGMTPEQRQRMMRDTRMAGDAAAEQVVAGAIGIIGQIFERMAGDKAKEYGELVAQYYSTEELRLREEALLAVEKKLLVEQYEDVQQAATREAANRYAAEEKAKIALTESFNAAQTLKNELSTGLVGALVEVTSAFGAMAAGAEGGFSAVGASAVRAIGGLASNLGQLLLMAGIGFSALPLGFSGAGAIGAGLGLIALGGLLGAASGAMGGKSGGSSASSGMVPGTTGVRSLAATQQAIQPLHVSDFYGATIVTNDPKTMRDLTTRQQYAAATGGMGGAL